MFKLRAPGNYDSNEASAEAALFCPEPSLTQQHQAADTDINLIVKRYVKTGMLPVSSLQPLYGDFQALSFHEAQNRIRAAREAFDRIPADVRLRFNNDPGQFMDFASKEENRAELVRLKLLDPPAAAQPPATPPQPASGPTGGSPNPAPQPG